MVFVGVGILSQLAMLNDHADDAFDMLTSFRRTIEEDTPQLIPSIETLRTRFLLYHGRSAAVADWMKTAPDEEQEFFIMERFRYLTKVRVYLAMGKKERAYNLIQRLLAYAEMMHRPYVHMECHVLLAIIPVPYGKFRVEADPAICHFQSGGISFRQNPVQRGCRPLGASEGGRVCLEGRKVQKAGTEGM